MFLENNVHTSSDHDQRFLLLMRVCCFRVFVDGQLWDCLLILKYHQNSYALYPTTDRLPFRVSAELRAFQLNGTRDPDPTEMDANCLECVIKTLENSNTFIRSVMRRINTTTSVDNNNIVVYVKDINLVTPKKYRLPYTWYNFYILEKKNLLKN